METKKLLPSGMAKFKIRYIFVVVLLFVLVVILSWVGLARTGYIPTYVLATGQEEMTYEEIKQTIPASIGGFGVSPYNDSVMLGWPGTEDESLEFLVYRGKSPDKLKKIATFKNRYGYFVDSSVKSGQTYYYAVSCKNIFGNESDLSEILSVVVGAQTIDSDGDGLNNAWESAYRYDPNNIDTDGNGVTDAEEDPDHDGYPNIQEQRLGTHPFVDNKSESVKNIALGPVLYKIVVFSALILLLCCSWFFLRRLGKSPKVK